MKTLLYGVIMAILVCCSGCSSENKSMNDLTDTLSDYDWQSYVGDKTGIWVSIERQELMLISNKRVIKHYLCSTAAAGAGNKVDSGMTPLGWHRVGTKIGGELEMGAVLKDREWTGEVWQSGQDTKDDLILSRILWLEGLEEGKNLGGDVDTWNRYIYIHGNNQVDDLGRPASAGCIRLDPQDVIDLYERVGEGYCVLIRQD
jgi:L,D-transpeptidase YbiS